MSTMLGSLLLHEVMSQQRLLKCILQLQLMLLVLSRWCHFLPLHSPSIVKQHGLRLLILLCFSIHILWWVTWFICNGLAVSKNVVGFKCACKCLCSFSVLMLLCICPLSHHAVKAVKPIVGLVVHGPRAEFTEVIWIILSLVLSKH